MKFKQGLTQCKAAIVTVDHTPDQKQQQEIDVKSHQGCLENSVRRINHADFTTEQRTQEANEQFANAEGEGQVQAPPAAVGQVQETARDPTTDQEILESDNMQNVLERS